MKVFITGSTGFIGKHLVSRLSAEGHEVTCLVRSPQKAGQLQRLGVEVIYGDLQDCAALKQGMLGCDWLFHLANLYSMWEPDPEQFTRVNIAGTRNVLNVALDCQVKKMVYVSTAAIYGKPSAQPFDENALPGPRLFSEYARTKSLAEQITWEYHCLGLPLVVLYPGIVLGAGDDKASGHYIQDIIRRRVPSTIFHNSFATYVCVDDLVDAMLQAARKPEAAGKKYLIGKSILNGREFSRLIGEISRVPLPLFRFPDWLVIAVAYLLTGLSNLVHKPPLWGLSVDAAWTLKNGFLFDGSKAERELGIHYSPIRKALSEAIDSYREQWTLKR